MTNVKLLVFLFHLFVTISGAEQQSTGLYYEYQDYPQDQFNNVLVDNQSGLNERNGSDLQEYQDTQDIQGYQDTPENESLEKTEEETISPQYIPDSLQTAALLETMQRNKRSNSSTQESFLAR
ncbi:uncharacterized protein LOC111700378 [Eurytemora carolleeae]|uniref:uncharacterized protein LOC111700378 n=1 Tax=Eurytemora carolleeae TaxID=1294199 RepID=UPI000C759B87|nr:uncharacterized protein LOC111700378 [Eurytemora carolleeae]|eukprot:XP_023327033.1 uncharacterized protein LOC111700378 [Eurytemora affinis]